MRGATVVVACVICGASASAPKAHAIRTTATVPANFDDTWAAVIDVFAERKWTIQTSDKASGLITTDWMRVDEEPYADCGSAPLATSRGTRIKFNVRVKQEGSTTSVAVNTAFQQLRQFDNQQGVVECASKGTAESLIHTQVSMRATTAASRKTEEAAQTFFCTNAPADATVAWCARSEAGCSRRQSDIIALAGDATPCAKREGASCFTGKTADGVQSENCHPSPESCQKQRDATQLADVTECK
jgi:hypothetical protein